MRSQLLQPSAPGIVWPQQALLLLPLLLLLQLLPFGIAPLQALLLLLLLLQLPQARLLLLQPEHLRAQAVACLGT